MCAIKVPPKCNKFAYHKHTLTPCYVIGNLRLAIGSVVYIGSLKFTTVCMMMSICTLIDYLNFLSGVHKCAAWFWLMCNVCINLKPFLQIFRSWIDVIFLCVTEIFSIFKHEGIIAINTAELMCRACEVRCFLSQHYWSIWSSVFYQLSKNWVLGAENGILWMKELLQI